MALQLKVTNRRQFLGRSALGAGSLLFGPLLLESCTDHLISDPKPKPNPTPAPIFGDEESIDWNEDAKIAVTTGLSVAFPEGGEVLSALVEVFWPGSNTTGPWDQVKAQVAQLVDQKLDENTFNNATGKLDKLNEAMQDYLQVIKDSTPTQKASKWGSLKTAFISNSDLFTEKNYGVMLLPLYVQYVNLYLSLLRDPLMPALDAQGNPIYNGQGAKATIGDTWGMTFMDYFDNSYDLKKFITTATKWVSDWYATGRDELKTNTAVDDSLNEPFTSLNKYDRQMTLLVLDYMDTWPYYDVNQYPKGPQNPDGTNINLFTREIYPDPYGNTYNANAYNTSPIVLPAPATQFPTQITVWAGSRIDAVQLTYPAGGGPGGVTQTPRMGDQNGGSANSFTLSPDQACTGALVSYENRDGTYWGDPHLQLDQYITSLELAFFDYNRREVNRATMGATLGKLQSPIIKYDNYAVSSIYVHGVNYKLGNTADCIVFGFMRRPQR